ncbi:hypothetical protein NW757_011202 [Fusarium falciforme]|nr:hypothetical protein NW757_011202 [Fusarium falciforme]
MPKAEELPDGAKHRLYRRARTVQSTRVPDVLGLVLRLFDGVECRPTKRWVRADLDQIADTFETQLVPGRVLDEMLHGIGESNWTYHVVNPVLPFG